MRYSKSLKKSLSFSVSMFTIYFLVFRAFPLSIIFHINIKHICYGEAKDFFVRAEIVSETECSVCSTVFTTEKGMAGSKS